ncbi:signal-induced proliferation-associated 1-like protein 1 [Lates japonicus]|uniref:Signal-induced proliferation-associated 1-like protein 1 n=1 Tax=Lates japonicus TaxID=270547 RepID=A0AAD3NII8_LATJO|nr:signal-induced proliferation-associated 1-like protein 1 [Lates japonicus]
MQLDVAVTRSQDVPSFGPPIPKGVTFPKSTVFRDFLLAKVINAENAAHKSDTSLRHGTRTRRSTCGLWQSHAVCNFEASYYSGGGEPSDYAWQAGAPAGQPDWVEICKVAVATSLSHEQMIGLLRTSVHCEVVIIPPH